MRNVLAGLVLLASTSLAQAADMLVTPAWLLEHKADKNLVLLHVGPPAEFRVWRASEGRHRLRKEEQGTVG